MENSAIPQVQEISITNLTDAEKAKVDEIVKSININDSQAIIQFGVSAQASISNFADTVLSQVRAKDAGYAGQILSDLMLKVKELKVDSLSGDSGFLSKVPLIGSMVDSVKKFITRYEKVSVEIDKIVDELSKTRMQLLKDISLLDTLFDKNKEYIHELDFFILAGQLKLKEIQEKTIPELKLLADNSKDTLDAQKVNDTSQMLNRFEKKVYDLKLSRMIAIQTAPQVRLIQNNDQLLVEKVQSSILNTIPLWKNQVVIAISIFRQKKAVELQKKVTETTNDLLKKNAEMLKESSLEVARESEKGIVEIETLKKVNEELLSTIEETIKIQEEGKLKRAAAEVELTKLEGDLKTKLAYVKDSGAAIKL